MPVTHLQKSSQKLLPTVRTEPRSVGIILLTILTMSHTTDRQKHASLAVPWVLRLSVVMPMPHKYILIAQWTSIVENRTRRRMTEIVCCMLPNQTRDLVEHFLWMFYLKFPWLQGLLRPNQVILSFFAFLPNGLLSKIRKLWKRMLYTT